MSPHCQTCSLETHDLYRHHIVPTSKGGLQTSGNMVKICGTCHGKIHGKLDMSYLTAFEKRHGCSFEQCMDDFDNNLSEDELCERLGINKALLTTLRNQSGLNHPGHVKIWSEDGDFGEYSEYIWVPFTGGVRW